MSGSIGGGWQSRGSPSQMSEKPAGQRSVLGGHNQRRASRLPHRGLESETTDPLSKIARKVPRHLGDEGIVGMIGDLEDVHRSSLQLDDEEHVEMGEVHGVDGEQVPGEDALGLRGEKLPP
jgi:hypothetical protein